MKINLLIIALTLYSSSVLSIENNYEPTLSHVSSSGQWSENGKKGHYRFIAKTLGSEHVFSKLYVQWLTYFEDGVGEGEIISEAAITELNGRYLYFTTPKCADKPKCTSYLLDTVQSFGKYKKIQFELEFPSVGTYVINEKAL